jgi:hypothetical protein
MFDTRTVENFRYLLEEAVRDYTRANNENQKLLLLIGEAAFDGESMIGERVQQYRAQYEDNKLTMTVSKDQFEFTKQKMLNMISNLSMPE